MVYKRYIKRNGKLCGPYYYESYRDKNGKVISKYLKDYKPKRNYIPYLSYFLGFFVLVILILLFYNLSFVFTGKSIDTFHMLSIPGEIDSCQVLNTAGAYTLNQSVNSSGNCFNITSSGITLNCNGYAINHNFYGIKFNDSDYSNIIIKNCIINGSSGSAIDQPACPYSVTNSVFYNNTIIQFSGKGINLCSSFNNNFSNNNITSSSYAISIYGPSGSEYISNNYLSSTSSYGIYFIFASPNNSIIKNNTFSTSGYNIFIDNNYPVDNLSFINQIITNYNISGTSNITVENTTYGKITLYNLNGSGNNLSQEIRILYNSMVVNVSNNLGLNRSAGITFYNLALTNYKNRKLLRNGNECNSSTIPSCYNLTTMYSDTIMFNISSWSNYSVFLGNDSEPPNLIINPSGRYYRNNLSINFDVVADENLSNCSITFNNWITNYSMNYINLSHFNYTNSSISEGEYIAKFSCNDSSGYINNSEFVSFVIDITKPNLNITSPLNMIYDTNNIIFGINSNENLSNCLFSLNNWSSNYSMSNYNSTYFYHSLSSLSNGEYIVRFSCNDNSGNFNNSEYTGFSILYIAPTNVVTTSSGSSFSSPLKQNKSIIKNQSIDMTQLLQMNNSFNDSGIVEEEIYLKEDYFNYSIIYPNPSCGPWSKCSAFYSLKDILRKSILLKEEQERLCIFKNFTSEEFFIEKRACESKVIISLKKNKVCFGDYLEIYENENLISRLSYGKERLDIQISLGTKYCPYCYDGVKNFDEDEIDCVNKVDGNCPKCLENKSLKDYWMFLIIGFFILVLVTIFSLTIEYLVIKNRYEKIQKRLESKKEEFK
ncbi:MAG: hypothetical protein Q8N99_07315 [Nanoarchaeota archaeon]|nr:hypothetical protein [Nanoarchaeota archaeon]